MKKNAPAPQATKNPDEMNIAELAAFIQEIELGHPHMTHETWKAYRKALSLVGNDQPPTKTWQEELAAGVFEDGLTDKGLDRHDFKDISKQTLKGIIDAAYSRGLAEATRDARLPHNR